MTLTGSKATMIIVDEIGLPPKVGDIWYRYQDKQYAPPLDEYDEPVGKGRTAVELEEYWVTKVTSKGVWLGMKWGDRFPEWSKSYDKFQLLTAGKKFACPTLELAKESFIARKKRQREIHQAWVNYADRCIKIIQGKDKTDDIFLDIL